ATYEALAGYAPVGAASHMALSLIATWFLVLEARRGKKMVPALTVPQVRMGLAMVLHRVSRCDTPVRVAREGMRRLERNEVARFSPSGRPEVSTGVQDPALDSKRGLSAAGVRRRYRGLVAALARHRGSCGGLAAAFDRFREVTRSYWPGLSRC